MKMLNVLFLLAIAVCTTVPAAAQEEFVRIQGDQFTYKGQVIRMKGTNYYPKNHMWQSMWTNFDTDEMAFEVTMIRELGMNCVRILVPYSNGGWGGSNPPSDRLGMLEYVVNLFGQNGIRSCVTLFDWETSFPDKTMDPAKFNDHISHLTAIVNRLKDNKYVFCWDVKNEPDHPANITDIFPTVVVDAWDDPRCVPGKKEKIVNWLREMCNAVDALDQNHPVSVGIRYFGNTKDVLPFVDIAMYHSYWWHIADTEITTVKNAMGSNIKPIVVEEFGWPSYPPSKNFTENDQLIAYSTELPALERHNVAGCIQWMTFDATTYGDNNHENYFGLWRHDYTLKPAGEYYRDHYLTTVFPYTDVTPPGSVWNFKAEAKNGYINLSWNNPKDLDFRGTLIRFSTTGYPTSITDGFLLTDQPGAPDSVGMFTHNGLTNGTKYYYSAFTRDSMGNYSSAETTSGTPYLPAMLSLLVNGTIDSTANGLANGWTAYKVNDPGNILRFTEDGTFDSMPAAQGITGIDSTSLPASSLIAAGIKQVVNNVTPGKTYMLTGMQDIYCDQWKATGFRYLHNFGINVNGDANPATADTSGTIGGAKWIGDGLTFWNKSSGGAAGIGGFHRVTAAHTAQNNTLSVWSGLTVATAAAIDPGSTRLITDSMNLYEMDNPVNYSNKLVNANFEQVIDLQNGQDTLPVGWVPVGGSIGQYSRWSTPLSAGTNGSRAATVENRRGHINMGYMQKISTITGANISFSVWARNCVYSNPSTATLIKAYIGIDPTGGTNIESGSVIWSIPTQNSTWIQLFVNAVAQGSTATLYIRGNSAGFDTGIYHMAEFDDATATWTPSDNIPPTNPTYVNDLNGARSGEWTNKDKPNFVFGGAADLGGSGVSGYDVYWGTDQNGNTVTASVINPSYQPPPVSAGTYYLRVRAKDAAGNNAAGWATLFTYKYDATAPTTPAAVHPARPFIIDGKISMTTEAASDPESGIADYLYAVGSTSGGTNIRTWTSIGNASSCDITDLSTQPGGVYYISLKARNGAGTQSTAVISGMLTGAVTEKNIANAKQHPNPQAVFLEGKVITAVFADRFYIEDPLRSCGIAVMSSEQLTIGDIVDVAGILNSTSDGEWALHSAWVEVKQDPRTPLKPLAMTLAALGGGALGHQSAVQSYNKGQLVSAAGANNIGLLVRVFGKVTSVNGSYFYINDGSIPGGLNPDGSGVCVERPQGVTVNVGDLAVVTGVSSCTKQGDIIYRLLRPLDGQSIQIIPH